MSAWQSIILTPRLSDRAILSASSAAPAMAVKNLQRKQPGAAWRPTGLTPWVAADLRSDQPVSTVAIITLNASPSGQWRIRGAALAGNLLSAPDYLSEWLPLRPVGATDDWPMYLAWHSVASERAIDYLVTQTGERIVTQEGAYLVASALGDGSLEPLRYWRVDFSDPDNADGFLDVGRLYLSQELPFSLGPIYGLSIGYTTQTKKNRSVGGQRYSVDAPSERLFDFEINFATEDEMLGAALEVDLTRGTSKDIIAILNRHASAWQAQKIIYGEFAGLTGATVPVPDGWNKRYQIEELLP